MSTDIQFLTLSLCLCSHELYFLVLILTLWLCSLLLLPSCGLYLPLSLSQFPWSDTHVSGTRQSKVQPKCTGMECPCGDRKCPLWRPRHLTCSSLTIWMLGSRLAGLRVLTPVPFPHFQPPAWALKGSRGGPGPLYTWYLNGSF